MIIKTKRFFCAMAVMTACTVYAAGFTSYAMSPDQRSVDSGLAELGMKNMTETTVQKAADKRQEREEQLIAEAEAARRAEEERIAAEEAARRAQEENARLLAALIFCEAGNQPYEGQVAVGAVVMNRVNSGAYPGTIRGVIYQSGQFGPAMTGWLDSVLAGGSYTQTALQAAYDALAGSDPSGGCLSFGNGNYGLRIGDHYFH